MKPRKTKTNAKAIGVPNLRALYEYKMLLVQAAILLAITTLIFYQDLSNIFSRALEFTQGNITNYVITIPALIAFIIYRRRHIIAAAASIRDRNSFRIDDAVGITLCVISMLLYVFGSGTLYSLELHMVAFTTFLAGGTMLLFNIATFRHVAVALLLTLYLQPPPGFLVSELAADLSWSIAVIVEGLLTTFGLQIVLDSSLGAPALMLTMADGNRVPFFVGEPSSGVFSTIGLSLFALFVAYIIRGTVWKRVTLFVIGFPIFFALNALRISIILSLWYVWGEYVAESFHLISGSLMMVIGTITLLILAEKGFGLNMRTPKVNSQKCPACSKSLTMGKSLCMYCGILLRRIDRPWNVVASRILLLGFLCGIVIAGSFTAPAAPVEAEATQQNRLAELDITTIEGPETVDYFLPQVAGWDLKYAYRDSRIESVLNQDAALAFRYTSNEEIPDNVSIATRPYVYASLQISTGHHTWKDSLVTYPSRVGRPGATIIEDSELDIANDVSGSFMLYKRVGVRTSEAVLYWFERVPLKFGETIENRNVLVSIWTNTDVLARSGMIANPEDSEAIKQLYLSIAKEIKDYWTIQVPQASSGKTVYSFINEYFVIISIAVILPGILFYLQYYVRKWLVRRANMQLYEQLPPLEKSFFSVFSSSVDRFMTGRKMATQYTKITGNQINEEEMLRRLELAQKSGLLGTSIASSNDNSVLIWKPNFKVLSNGMQNPILKFKRILHLKTPNES